MPHYQKTRDELVLELSEQASALRASAKSYDSGNTWEGKRLATTAYILVHDAVKGPSKSLLTQLGLRSSMKLISSISNPSDFDPKHMQLDCRRGLIIVVADGTKASFSPKLDLTNERYRRVQFHEWYDEPIFQGVYGPTISRKNLIHYLRSQDGGAHVDTHLTNQSYFGWKQLGDPAARFETTEDGVIVYGPMVDLRTGETVFPTSAMETGEPVPNAVPAAMRQVAWELDKALTEIGF